MTTRKGRARAKAKEEADSSANDNQKSKGTGEVVGKSIPQGINPRWVGWVGAGDESPAYPMSDGRA